MQPSIPWSSSVSAFVIERTAIIHSLKCTVPFSLVAPLLSFAVTHCYLLSLVVTRRITRCHSLSVISSVVVTPCHSLSLVVPLVVTPCHSLSLIAPLVVTRSHSLSLVITRGTTRLSFYKRSFIYLFIYFFADWNCNKNVA